jgi:ribosome-associated protein
MLQIAPGFAIDESEIHEEFTRSSVAGGQNVNKVSTAVQLRFDVMASPSLKPEVKARLVQLAGKRMTADGVLILKAQTYRTQERNRQDALDRLKELLIEAARRPVIRRPTRPTKASQRRRLDAKRLHSQTKERRRIDSQVGE